MESRTTIYIHSGAIFNVHFREITPETRGAIMSARQAVLAFFVSVLVNFLQLKYQGKDEPPFETNPNTMFVAILSLFIYCLAYDIKLRDRHNTSTVCKYFVRINMVIFGPLSLASILSLLSPGFFQPILYVGAFLYSVSQIPRFSIKLAWIWLQVFIAEKFCRRADYRPSGERLSSVIQGLRVHEHTLMIDQVD